MYKMLGHFGRGIGFGLTIAGVVVQDMETIAGGFGIAYISNAYIRNSDANAHAREQTNILQGIEKKLKE